MRFIRLKNYFILVILLTGNLLPQSDKSFYLEKNFDKDKVIASVDTITITAEEFYLGYEFGPAFIKKAPDSRQKYLEYMINEKLLALDGYSRGVDTAEEVSGMITEFKNDLSTEAMFKDEILSKVDIDEKEIDSIIIQKQLELEIKWLYAGNEEAIKDLLLKMNSGISFDSLFTLQINDSVFYDDRYMKTNRYMLGNKNQILAGIIDSLKAGEVSVPVHVEDGWYILKLENVWQNRLTNESEYIKLKEEANNAAVKKNMDRLSDEYVNNLMMKNSPVIKRDAFNLVRSYLAKFYLDKEKYKEWQLEQKLNEALSKLSGGINEAELVELNSGKISVAEFINWYRNRSEYIKLNENSLETYSVSLERLVWVMVRDNLLSNTAKQKNYDLNPEVTKQLSWWKDKITSSAVRNEIVNSAAIETDEINQAPDNNKETDAQKVNAEFQKRLLHKILSLKSKYAIKINQKELAAIPVSSENDERSIEFYTVKTGGLIPRTPYPTINQEWVSWE